MKATKKELKKTELVISSYYGNISFRLYDGEKRKNVAKLETKDMYEMINKMVKKGLFEVEEFKGNALPVVTLKQ